MKSKLKRIVKEFLKYLGIEVALNKNLKYRDPFHVIKNLVNEVNPIIFDVGANNGGMVDTFNNLFSNAKIFAFEPIPEVFQMLEKHTINLTNVFCMNIALSNKSGEADFYITNSPDSSSLFKSKKTNTFIDKHTTVNRKITVVTLTLDEFVIQNKIQRIDVLKIDVQGAELAVLNGAKASLANRTIKYIYLEFWFIKGYEEQPLYHEVASFLQQYGYIPFALFNIHYRKDGHFMWGDALFYLK